MTPRRPGRKLLVAAIGVATASYLACTSGSETSGNLMAPPDTGAPGDAADQDRFVTSGNLVAPVVDAGDAGDASDAGDADSGPKK